MEMLEASDLTGVDEGLALRLIGVALTIAPCLDNLVNDTRAKKTAIAILREIAKDSKVRGSRVIKSQRAGPASVEYVSTASLFSDDDRASLRNLCAPGATDAGPIGRFPPPSRAACQMWPEEHSLGRSIP